MLSKTFSNSYEHNSKSPTVISKAVFKTKKFVCNHPILILSFLMIITSIIIFFKFIFQNQIFIYNDIGGDTQSVYYPFFLSLARKLNLGDFSMWDFTYGLGTNILTRQADVGSIFTWLTCALGAGGVKYALAYVQILKILISGYICYFYLNTFKFTALSKVIFSYVFAFNGFTMLWGQHYFFATASLYIVLMFLAIEKSFISKSGYLFVAFAAFFVMVDSYYLAYMVLLTSAIYALFRLAFIHTFKEIKHITKKILFLLASVILGWVMSAFLFLPAATTVVGTSGRIGSNSLLENFFHFATSFYNTDTIIGVFSRIFSNNLIGTTDYVGPLNYYEMPQWFFTSFILFFSFIFVSQIFLDKTEKTKIKVLKLSAFALISLLAFHPLISFILNGFVDAFFRYTYLIMPLFALCFASVLDKIINRKLIRAKLQIIGATIFSLIILSFSLLNFNSANITAKSLGCLYILMIVALMFLSIILQFKKLTLVKRIICIFCVAILITTNVTVDGYVTTNNRDIISEVHKEIYLTSGNDEVAQALDYINKNDDSFYRTDKTFRNISFLNDSMIQGYYGISSYNSVINKNIIDFAKEFCPEFSITDKDGYYDFDAIHHRIDIISLLGVKYVLSYVHYPEIPEYSYITTFGNVHLYENSSCTGIGKFFSNAIDYNEYNSLSNKEKENLINDTLIVNQLGDKTFGNNSPDQSKVCFEKPTNSSYITGRVDATEDGFVFVPIPFEKGWEAYVDGVKTDILQADIAFSAVKVSEGTHKIEFKYNTPLLKEGCIISIIGLVVFTIWSVILIISNNKKNRGN